MGPGTEPGLPVQCLEGRVPDSWLGTLPRNPQNTHPLFLRFSFTVLSKVGRANPP